MDELPLISTSATVTAVEAMDQDRTDEIRARVRTIARKHGFQDAVPSEGPIDWPAVFDRATEHDRRLAPQIGALRERYERAHPAMLRVVFETDEPVDFAAGQYVSIRYDNRTRPYSIASSPTRDATELCVRRVPDGRLSPRLCEDLAVGDRITVRGPNGHLLLEDPSDRDMAFLATGTGVAPLKSMIEYTLEQGWDEYRGHERTIWLFLGAAWVDDLPYHETFKVLDAERDNVHYIPCLSREPWLSTWNGETEYIQDAMMQYVDERSLEDAVVGRHIARMLADRPTLPTTDRIDPQQLEVYACGINAMVHSLDQAVTRLGVPERHIHCEGYG